MLQVGTFLKFEVTWMKVCRSSSKEKILFVEVYIFVLYFSDKLETYSLIRCKNWKTYLKFWKAKIYLLKIKDRLAENLGRNNSSNPLNHAIIRNANPISNLSNSELSQYFRVIPVFRNNLTVSQSNPLLFRRNRLVIQMNPFLIWSSPLLIQIIRSNSGILSNSLIIQRDSSNSK